MDILFCGAVLSVSWIFSVFSSHPGQRLMHFVPDLKGAQTTTDAQGGPLQSSVITGSIVLEFVKKDEVHYRRAQGDCPSPG